jgi:hypothetical protein
MSASIRIRVGSIEFVGDGSEEWVEEQYSRFLEDLPRFTSAAPDPGHNADSASEHSSGKGASSSLPPLPKYLEEKGAHSSQAKKFLVTAAWLQRRGKTRLAPRDVSAALREASQSKLANPSESLRQNIRTGRCERDGADFYVTEVGFREVDGTHA